MLDKIWEFVTSDDKVDRLLLRAALLGILILLFCIARVLTVGILIALGILVLGVAVVIVLMIRADKKAESDYQRLLTEEDDGVTGYIAVRPEELNGAPWETRKQ